MKLSDLLKKFFTYRKYFLADKILKMIAIVNHRLGLGGEHAVYKYKFQPFHFETIVDKLKNITNFRTLEAIDILEENGHINKTPNENIFQIIIVCTDKGER